jgi:O-antigen/teichoic acid export membrane protein
VNLSQYFKNVSLLFIINFAIKPIWVFGIDRKFQLILGQEAYGSYFSYLSLIYIFNVVLDMGLHNYTVKAISEQRENYKSILAELWLSKLILVSFFLLIVFISIFIQGLDFNQGLIFFLIAIEMLTFSLYQYLRCFSQGLQLLKLDSLLSSLDRILLIILGGSILFLYSNAGSISLIGFISFHILAYSLCFIGVWLYLRSKISFSLDKFSIIQLKKIILDGWPLLIIVLMMTVYTRADVVMLKYMLPDGELQCGSLAYANRFIDSAYNAMALLSVFLLPTIAFHFAEKKHDYIRKVVLISFIISSILALGFIICSYIFGTYLYGRLYPLSTSLDVTIFKTQTWTVLGVGWMYVFGSYLTATGRFKALMMIVTIGVLMGLGLNLELIPSHKALGTAISSSIVQMTMGILHMMVAIYYLSKNKLA